MPTLAELRPRVLDRLTVNWSSTRTFAPLQGESAQKEVDYFFETLSTSVD
ncbi:hypothetical protein [Arthrobacter sp. MMS24-S77]